MESDTSLPIETPWALRPTLYPPKTLRLPCRYYRVYTDDEADLETRFSYVERELPIPVEQSALILVDVWNMHHTASYLERSGQITHEKIVPLLTAARQVGMTVIHAPSPRVAERYNPPSQDAPAKSTAALADSTPLTDDWPPPAFRNIYRSGNYAVFGRNHEASLDAFYAQSAGKLDIAAEAAPVAGEPVIATGAELHHVLAQRRILHLFYCGFATNWCVMLRDYGVIAMAGAGYNLILLRDATTGVEFHNSIDTLAATGMAIQEIEAKFAWSTETSPFVEACQASRPATVE